MRNLIICLALLSAGTFAQADESATKEMIEMKLQQLAQVDQQIENLVKQRVQLKAEAQAEIQHGADSILPRQARREDRSAEQTMQQVQALTQQIEQLEAQRQQILMALQ